MNVGRLAWRTPTGAMLWEIWGRRKLNFLWQGAALAASVFFVHWKEHGGDGGVLGFASFCCFLGAYCNLLICFGHIEIDARIVQIGFPGRLLLKPVSTARLVLAPMVFGGGVIVAIFAIWAELVWRYWIGVTTSDLLWISAVLLSFFWWMQTLAWSLSWFKGRMLVVVMVAVIHFFVWQMPQMPTSALSGWRWPILAVLLLSAVPAAWTGLKLTRQGQWEGPSWIAMLWSRLRFARARGRRKKFGSAFRAQFWLEWRRQALLPTGFGAGMAFLFFPLCLKCFQWVGADAAPPEPILIALIMPLLASVLMAPSLAKFDPLHSIGEMPVYIAVRPMSNGGFVMAKLAMALATSALIWLITAVSLCFWLTLLEKGALFSKAGWVTTYGPVAYMTGCVPVLLLLVIWTWKNLVAGIGVGLTGRLWIVGASVECRLILLVGLVLLVDTARTNVNFREALLHWLTGILVVCLAAKIAFSIAAFAWGLRRNAITARAVGWIIAGWLVCGLVVAGYAGHVCHTIHKPDLWIWVALGGFLIFPLADLAIAPMALAWSRHR
jgi:hypothetical protein